MSPWEGWLWSPYPWLSSVYSGLLRRHSWLWVPSWHQPPFIAHCPFPNSSKRYSLWEWTDLAVRKCNGLNFTHWICPFSFSYSKKFQRLISNRSCKKKNTYLNNSPSNPGVKDPEYQVGLTSELHSSQYWNSATGSMWNISSNAYALCILQGPFPKCPTSKSTSVVSTDPIY